MIVALSERLQYHSVCLAFQVCPDRFFSAKMTVSRVWNRSSGVIVFRAAMTEVTKHKNGSCTVTHFLYTVTEVGLLLSLNFLFQAFIISLSSLQELFRVKGTHVSSTQCWQT